MTSDTMHCLPMHALVCGRDVSKTEDTGYYYTPDHNYMTPWNFAKDVPLADVIVLHLGYAYSFE